MAGDRKDMKRLSRSELVEIIYELQRREDEYKERETESNLRGEDYRKQISELEAKVADRDTKLSNAGSIAEASLAISNIFSEAQGAADQYLYEVKRLRNNARSESDGILAEAKQKADQMIAEAEAQAKSMVADAESKAQQMLDEAQHKADEIAELAKMEERRRTEDAAEAEALIEAEIAADAAAADAAKNGALSTEDGIAVHSEVADE